MRRLILLMLPVLFFVFPGVSQRARQDAPTPTPTELPSIGFQAPAPGQALQGMVTILGTTTIPGFQSATLAFAYMNNPTHTWFLIAESDQPANRAALAQWDTTTITDGNYQLRLTINRQDGSQLSTTLAGLRVRNYSPIETNTPTPVTPTATPLPGDTPLPTVTPTPTLTPIPPTGTPLPPNPAQISQQDILGSLGTGALSAAAILVLIGLYIAIKNLFRR